MNRRDHFLRPRLSAVAWFRSHDDEPHVPDPIPSIPTASGGTDLSSRNLFEVRDWDPHSGSVLPRSSALRRGSALVCIEPARAPLERHVGGSVERRDLRTTNITNTLRGPRCARLNPARRNGPCLRTGCARWMAMRTPWRLQVESAGEQAPALRSGAERGPMPRGPRHHPVPSPPRRDLPGGAAPATPESLTPPSSERSAGLSLVDRRRVVFELPTTRRSLTGDFVPGGSPILSIASPASTSCNHLSLAGPPSPSGEGRRSSLVGERLEAEAPGRPARSRRRLRSAATLGPEREWVDPSHEHPSSHTWLPSRRRPRWLVCETPRAPIPTPE